jgi:hypothetical protein
MIILIHVIIASLCKLCISGAPREGMGSMEASSPDDFCRRAGRCNTRQQPRGHALLAVASSASEESTENNGEEQVSARFMSRRAKRRRRTMPDTARWKRRPLQADEDRWRKYLEINTNEQGIQVLLDLDNASDSIDPIEACAIRQQIPFQSIISNSHSKDIHPAHQTSHGHLAPSSSRLVISICRMHYDSRVDDVDFPPLSFPILILDPPTLQLFKMQDLVTMKGFAGVDYSGKTPEWLPIKTCSVFSLPSLPPLACLP